MTKVKAHEVKVTARIIIRPATCIQEAAGKELWHRLLRANRETHLNCQSGHPQPVDEVDESKAMQ